MINTLYQEKSGGYQKKNAVLTVHAIIDKRGSKKIGTVTLNLSELVSVGKNNEAISIGECSDRKAKIWISVKGQALGDSISDNQSEASANSASIGAEGEFSGSIFHEQESSELDEESKSKTLQIFSKKPPVFRRGTENSKSSGFEGEENLRYIEIKAANSLLEKENQQLKTEKEDIKIQLSILNEKAKKEREMFCEHANKLDLEIDSFKQEILILKNKNAKRKDELSKLRKTNEELLEEIDRSKSNYNSAEKIKLLDEIKHQKLLVFNAQKSMDKLKIEYEDLLNENDMTENLKEQLQSLNLKYLADISQLNRKIDEIQDSFLKKIPEDQVTWKKKVDSIISELKKELTQAQNERDEAISKQTDMLSEMQKIKKNLSGKDNKLNEKIKDLEFKIDEKDQEISYLAERLEEEVKNSKNYERKTICEKEEFDGKLQKLNKTVKELAYEKASVEKDYLDHQRKYVRNRSETDVNSLEKLQKSLAYYQTELQKLKNLISQKEAENQELTERIYHLEHAEEVYELGSDDLGSSFSKEQVKTLKGKIINSDNEKSSLLEKIKILEKQLELSIAKTREIQKSYDNQIADLRIQIITLQDKTDELPVNSKSFTESMQEESYKQVIEMKKLEIKELKNLIIKLQEELKSIEKKYMDIKVSMANLDLQKENIFVKYRETQDILREYSNDYTMMEVELYKINERFCQSVNQNNDLENEIQNLKSQICDIMKRKRQIR